MKAAEFDFQLDLSIVPHDPVELRGKTRDGGRMTFLDRSKGEVPGDLLVLNDSYMLLNMLSFKRGDATAQISVYGYEPGDICIVRIESKEPLAKAGLGLSSMDNDHLTLRIVEPHPDYPERLWRVMFEPFGLLISTLEQHEQRLDEFSLLHTTYWETAPQAYRSVFAKKPGSLQIPSAGLHFSSECLAQATAKGVEIAYITLHVATAGSLMDRKIHEEDIEDHNVGSEYFEVGEIAAAQISQAKADGRRVIAIGTTVLRTLESLVDSKEPKATFRAKAEWTDLYIYPGFDFKLADMLLTSLHHPRSSHLILVSAFGGKDLTLRGYSEIIDRGGYEFDSFGDCSVIKAIFGQNAMVKLL
ncbi:S-adenosylmethionine:tRNA ribosyltransferase-isomerase [Trichoderma chlorosporum]